MTSAEEAARELDNEAPKRWARVRLGTIHQLTYGKSLTKGARNSEGEYPVYGSNGIVGRHDAYLVEGPVLVIGRKGAAGAVSFCAQPCWPIDTTYYVRPNEHLDIRFSYYLLTFLRLSRFDRSTAIPGLNRDDVHRLRVAIPPLAEQRRIINRIEVLFDEIDRGVQSLRDAKRAIELYRQSLLKSAFEGRLTASWRAVNAEKLESPDALLQRIREERETRYRAALEDWERSVAHWREDGEKGKRPAKPKQPIQPERCGTEGLRELPEGWFYLSFNAIAQSVRNGISVKPDEIGPLKILRISAVRPMAFDLNDFRRITDPDGRMEDYRLEHGDLVFTRYNGSRDYVGVSAMYRGDGTHVYPDKLIRCRIDSNIINPAYLEAATNCGESRSHVEGRIRTTAGQSGVSGSDIKTIPVPICSPTEQAEIVRILDARLDAADALNKEIDANLARAEALRQSILKKAFSGDLVPQDPADEPAASLLQRITTENESRKPKRTTRKLKAPTA